MEATLNLLQPLFEDIQNFLGGEVFLQSQSFPCLGEVLLERGVCAQTWFSPGDPTPISSVLTCTSVLKARNRSSVSCKTESEFPGMAKLASCSSPGPESHSNT